MPTKANLSYAQFGNLLYFKSYFNKPLKLLKGCQNIDGSLNFLFVEIIAALNAIFDSSNAINAEL